jgi:regulator of protease activity HflC (stomatin/prohibitin superfamily)
MDLPVIILVIIILVGLSGLRVANQYQRAVVLRLGQFQSIRGPGLYWLIPLIEWQGCSTLYTESAQQQWLTI